MRELGVGFVVAWAALIYPLLLLNLGTMSRFGERGILVEFVRASAMSAVFMVIAAGFTFGMITLQRALSVVVLR